MSVMVLERRDKFLPIQFVDNCWAVTIMLITLRHSQKAAQWSLFSYQERSVVDINAVLSGLHVLGGLLDFGYHEVNGNSDGILELLFAHLHHPLILSAARRTGSLWRMPRASPMLVGPQRS